MENKYYKTRKAKLDALVDQGLCGHSLSCRKPLAEGRRICQYHYEYRKKNYVYNVAKDDGTCGYVKCDSPAYSSVMCFEHYASQRLKSIENRAQKKRVSFELSVADVPRIKECPCCNLPITPDSLRERSLSADRLDPTKGYTLDNVVWICNQCNRRKSDSTQKISAELQTS